MLSVTVVPITAQAALINTTDNEVVISQSVPKGKIGRSMNVTFYIVNNSGVDWEDVEARIFDAGFYLGDADSPE